MVYLVLKFSTSSHTSLRNLLKPQLTFLPNVLQWFPIMLRVESGLLALPSKTYGIWLSQFSCLGSYSSLASLFLPFCLLLEHLSVCLLALSSAWNAFCSPSHGCFLLLFGSLVVDPPSEAVPDHALNRYPRRLSTALPYLHFFTMSLSLTEMIYLFSSPHSFTSQECTPLYSS